MQYIIVQYFPISCYHTIPQITTSEWSEGSVVYGDIAYDETPVGTALVEKSRLGGTEFTVRTTKRVVL